MAHYRAVFLIVKASYAVQSCSVPYKGTMQNLSGLLCVIAFIVFEGHPGVPGALTYELLPLAPPRIVQWPYALAVGPPVLSAGQPNIQAK